MLQLLFGAPPSRWRSFSSADDLPPLCRGDLLAQLLHACARRRPLACLELAVLEFALGQQLALGRKPPLEVGDAVAEHLGFLDLGDELAVEIGDALAQILDPAARVGEVARRGLRLVALLGEAGFGRGELLGGVADAGLQLLDLGPHRDQFDLAAVGGHRAVVECGVDLAELALLVGQRLLGVAQQLRSWRRTPPSVARSCSFIAFSRASSAKIAAFFSPSSIFMRLIASVFLPSSASWLVVLLLSWSTLISSRRADMRELGAQLVLVGLDLGHRQRGAASIRRVVSRTARLCTSGTIIEAAQHRDQETDRRDT